MIIYNTLLEVPVEIREFYFEETVSELTGAEVSEGYTYIDEDGLEQTGIRMVPEYADVLYINEKPRHDLKSWADVERVKAKGKLSVVSHFIAKAVEADNWAKHDTYNDWLTTTPDTEDEKYLVTETSLEGVETLIHS